MVKSERTGRPPTNTFVISMIQTKIIEYRTKYNLTTWNAYKKLTEDKHFKELMRHWFNNKRKKVFPLGKRQRLNREDLERFMANEQVSDAGNRPQERFYLRHIKRNLKTLKKRYGSAGLESFLETQPKDYTRRKKRK